MRVSDVLRDKGSNVVTVKPEIDVRTLVGMLAEHRVGAIVVSADGRTIAGIVSERDVVRALAARGEAVLAEPVSTIMTSDVQTCTPEANIDELMRTMTAGRFRHLPVVVDQALVGIVSIGDVVKRRVDELESEREALSRYITSGTT